MEFLKKVWPFAFQVKKQDSESFRKWLIVGIVACVVTWILGGLFGGVISVPVLSPILRTVFWLAGTYATAHSGFCILRFTGVFKDEESKDDKDEEKK